MPQAARDVYKRQHYGFIDGGHMLQQISAKDIEECCRECLELTVDDAPKAAVSLESRLLCTSRCV